MDPFAIPAEIVTILSAVETLPNVQHRRGSHKERQEAYLAYLREAYRFMSGINHLAILAEVKPITWREKACVVVTLIPAFVDFALPAEPSGQPAILKAQEMAKGLASLSKAAVPLATSAVEHARKSDLELRNQALVDIAVIREVTADFMAALAAVRLIGRPCSLAAADTIRRVFQDVLSNMPTQKQPLSYLSFLTHKDGELTQAQEFAYRINTLGEALRQFQSVVQTDHLERAHLWQIWRRHSCTVRSSEELLTAAREDFMASVRPRRSALPPAPER